MWTQVKYQHNGMTLSVYHTGGDAALPLCLWGHGWGLNAQSFLPLVQELVGEARHAVLDFPGFGDSSLPPKPWGVPDYAQFVGQVFVGQVLAQPQASEKIIWVGHSFGCRVGVHVAAKKLLPVQSMVLLGCPGLSYRRPFLKQLKLSSKRLMMKGARLLPDKHPLRQYLREKMGSADYKAAGALRPTLIKVLQDDLTGLVPQISCPVTLLFGDQDTETPPAIGQRFCQLKPDAQMHVLPGLGHNTILTDGRIHVARFIRDEIKKVSTNAN